MVSIAGVGMVANFPRQNTDTNYLIDTRNATDTCLHFANFTVQNIKHKF